MAVIVPREIDNDWPVLVFVPTGSAADTAPSEMESDWPVFVFDPTGSVTETAPPVGTIPIHPGALIRISVSDQRGAVAECVSGGRGLEKPTTLPV